MNFFKALFGGKEENTEEKQREELSRQFETLKFDGVRALHSGEFHYAIKCFQSALELQDDLETMDYISQAYIHNNDLLPAYDILQKLSEAQPDNQEILIRMANVAYMMEDYAALGSCCERALLLGKDNPVVYLLYAHSCKGVGDDVNAIAMLTKAITLREDYPEAYLFRGQTLMELHDLDSADEDAAWLLANDADHEDALMLKARIERARGNLETAIAYYNKVVDVNPFSVDAFRERGALKMETGDRQGAAEDAEKVIELNPKEMEEVNGEYKGEGKDGQDIQQKIEKKYKAVDPYGVFGNIQPAHEDEERKI